MKTLKQRVGSVFDGSLSSFAALSQDIYRGLFLGAGLGAVAWTTIYPSFGLVVGVSVAFIEYITSPSHSAWRSFIKKRSTVTTSLRQPNFSWPLAGISTMMGGLMAYKMLSEPAVANFLASASWPEDKQQLLKLFTSAISFSAYTGSFVYRIGASLPKDFFAFHFKQPHLAKISIASSFQYNTDKKISSLEYLAKQGLALSLRDLVKEKTKDGKRIEALSLVLNYFYKDKSLSTALLSPVASRKNLIVDDALLNKPALDLFITSLLSNQEFALTNAYAKKAISQAKEQKDIAALVLLATYQQESNDFSVVKTWRKIAHLVKKSSLEEKVLGEGKSGGASQLLFSGVKDDPLRWSIVTTTGNETLLRDKYRLGKAIAPKTCGQRVFSTPRMIELFKENNSYRLFRQQLWGVPLDEFSIKNQNGELFYLYADILEGIYRLQNIYEEQDKVFIPQTNWEEKYLFSKNNFYNKRILEESLDWLLETAIKDSELQIQQRPIVDPYVRNIGVHKTKQSLSIPYWDVEPRTRAPRIYDYATLLLTAKPALSSQLFSKVRELVLMHYQLTDSFCKQSTLRAYGGATVLRTVSLLKAWSNATQQPGMLAKRESLLNSAIQEMRYLRQQDDNSLANFAEQNTNVLSNLKTKLDSLATRFSR